MRRFISLAAAGAMLAVLASWLGERTDAPPVVEPTPIQLREARTEPSVVETLQAPELPTAAALQVRTEPDILAVMQGTPLPEVESPPWSDEMESRILSYIAQHSSLALTDLQVQCESTGCVIVMGGPNIPLSQLKFPEFTAQNGFAYAVLRAEGSGRKIVHLRVK